MNVFWGICSIKLMNLIIIEDALELQSPLLFGFFSLWFHVFVEEYFKVHRNGKTNL